MEHYCQKFPLQVTCLINTCDFSVSRLKSHQRKLTYKMDKGAVFTSFFFYLTYKMLLPKCLKIRKIILIFICSHFYDTFDIILLFEVLDEIFCFFLPWKIIDSKSLNHK